MSTAFESPVAGEKVVFELWADRLDSPLRGTLEIIDATGRRLIADRGRLGAVDPRIDFTVPADGEYTVRVFDQTYLGGADFIYRLAVDAGPHVDFATPAMLSLTASRPPLTLWGRNLGSSPAGVKHGAPRLGSASLENQVGELDVARQGIDWTPLRPSREAFVDMVAARWSSSFQPFSLALSNAMPINATTNNSVIHGGPLDPTALANTPLLVEDGVGNHGSATAKTVAVPSNVAGRLAAADEQDWYVFECVAARFFGWKVLPSGLGRRSTSSYSSSTPKDANCCISRTSPRIRSGRGSPPTPPIRPAASPRPAMDRITWSRATRSRLVRRTIVDGMRSRCAARKPIFVW